MFYKNISISAMKVLLISAFASTAEKQCLLSSSPPSSLFVPTGPFCVHGICITSRIQNISSYSHPDELSSKPKCPNKTTILEWLFVNFNREQTYLIFVVLFTRTKFLENKIYTEKTRKLRQNTQKIANFCVITAKYTVNCQFFALNL